MTWPLLEFALLVSSVARLCLTQQLYLADDDYFPKLENKGNNATLFPIPPCGNFTLEESTIDQMQQAMQRGQLSAVQLLSCYTERAYQTKDYLK